MTLTKRLPNGSLFYFRCLCVYICVAPCEALAHLAPAWRLYICPTMLGQIVAGTQMN